VVGPAPTAYPDSPSLDPRSYTAVYDAAPTIASFRARAAWAVSPAR
jgi:hypothetical protein